MSRFWNPRIHALHPYIPGEQPQIPNLVKLNTNELPYGPSPKVLDAIRSATTESLRLYPDPTALKLRETIARRFDTTPDRVFVGNGSDEVLAHAFRALFAEDTPILFPDVSYSFYPVYCGLFGLEARTIPLTETYEIDVTAYTGPCGGVIIPNPNAPTGIALPLDAVEQLVTQHPNRTVIIDEAYVDFGAASAVSLTAKHDNLLVIQTLSKSRALAGLRVGFAIGHPDLIEGLTRVKDSFNSYPLGRPAQEGAIAAIEDDAWTRTTTARVIETRTHLIERLTKLGFHTLPSSTNFLFTQHPNHTATDLAAALRTRAILVRHLKGERTRNWLRITIGTAEECHLLTTALTEILNLQI